MYLDRKMKVSAELALKLKKLTEAMYNEEGHEMLNPNPLFLDIGPKRLSLQEQIQRCLSVELSRQAYDQGFETLEEALDFDVGDEAELQPESMYQAIDEEFVTEVPPAEAIAPEPDLPPADAPVADPPVADPPVEE